MIDPEAILNAGDDEVDQLMSEWFQERTDPVLGSAKSAVDDEIDVLMNAWYQERAARIDSEIVLENAKGLIAKLLAEGKSTPRTRQRAFHLIRTIRLFLRVKDQAPTGTPVQKTIGLVREPQTSNREDRAPEIAVSTEALPSESVSVNPVDASREPGEIETPAHRYPPTSESIKALAADLLEHPDLWFEAPNPRFGGRKPADLLGTEEQIKIYRVLMAVDGGLF